MELNHVSTRMNNVLFRTTLTIWVLFMPSLSYAASGITYHGRILKPNGQPVNSTTVQFRIQIRTPGVENCLLWDEQQSRDLSASAGIFSITIADTSDPTLLANTLPFTLERTFSNRTPYTGLTNCSSGSAYTPSSSVDGRNLQVYFREAPTDPWEQMPPAKINFVPLALNSVQLEGYGSAEFLKIDPLAVYSPLTAANVDTLEELIAGTNNQYLKPNSAFSGDVTGNSGATVVEKIRGTNVVATAPTVNQVLKYDGTNWVPSADATGTSPGDASYSVKGIVQVNTDLATSGLFISSGVIAMPNVITAAGPIGGASSIPVITYDQKGRLTAVSTATVDDTTKLPLAGGTMSGSINMGGQNLTNAASVAATNFSGRNLILNDNDTNTVTMRTPTDVTANYALTLPPTAGTSGYVLATDGAGVLSWINPSSGSVTNVSSANSYLSVATGSTTPVLTLNVGTAANTVAAGDDARILGAVQTSAYNADLLPAASCTSVQKPSWNTVSDAWECIAIGTVANATSAVNFSGSLAGDVSGTQGATSVDKIKGIAVSAATANNQIMIYNGTAWVNNVMSGDATLASSGALTLASTITAGSAGSASSVPAITYDAKGRLTSVTSSAYQDATAGVKGVVQVGANLTVSSGTISLSNANALAAIGYTPVNKAGDTMTGTFGLYATAADPSTAGWNATQKGYTWFNSTSNEVKYWDGSAIQALGISGAGLTSLGGQTGSTQTFAAGSSGNSPAIASAANVHTLNVPLASAGAAVTSGTISNSDYAAFVAKLTSPLTTKGDLLSRDGTTHVRLPVGTNGQVLAANSAAASGLEWVTPTTGDITDVVAGSGLTGGAASGSATVNVAAGTGIIVNADDVAVDVGTTVGKIVQVQASGKLPALDGSDLTNLDAGDIATGTLPIARGGTGQTSANAALNAFLPAQATQAGKVLSTDGTNTSWIAAALGTVTNVSSSNNYITVATGGTTPVITAVVGTAANTLAAGDDARIVGALQTSVYDSDIAPITGAGACTATQTTYWNGVSGTWACQNIGTVANATNAVNFSGSLVGDVSGTQGATSIDKIKGIAVTAATANNQIMIYNGTSWVNNIMSGDATLASSGALTLASTITAGSAGSASSVPAITYDAKGRITAVSSSAYQDATGAAKGIVQVGSNLTVSSGTISLSNANALAAIGYTPVNKAGDTMTGTFGLYATAADPSTAGWNATQKGYTWFNSTSNEVKYWDGSAIQALGISGAGLTSLGGQTGSTQTFANAATGTAPAFSSAANVHTLNIPLASGAGVTSGTITKTDYDKFNNGTTISGTSGGIPYYNSATTMTSSGLLTANGVLLGGGAGLSPTSTTAGTANQVLRIPAGGGAPAFGLIDLTASMLGVLPIANGGTNSATALTNGKVMVSSAGAIVEGVASNTAKSNNTFVMRDGSGNIAGAGGTFDQLNVNGSVSGTVGIVAPSTFTSWNMTLPVDDGTAGQVLSTDGSGVTSWVTALTASTGFMNGGNSFGGTATIGTNDNQNLDFETNGSTKMTIRADGNVGINNTNPGWTLAIDKASGSNVIYQNASNGSSLIFQQSIGGYGSFTAQTARAGWTASLNGDYLYEYGASGFDGTSFITGGSMRFQIDGATGPNDMPTSFVVQTTADGASSPVERFRIKPSGDVGIGTASPSQKLHVVGNLRVQGSTDCTLGNGSGGTNCTSDERLKSNIQEIVNPMGKILALRGVEFDWNEKSGSPGRHDIGVIAQDVEKVFPTAVITDNQSGYKKVDYAVLVAPLIQAFKELFKTSEVQSRNIASLKEENAKLKAQAEKEKLAKDKEIADLKVRMEKLEKLLLK